MGFYSDPKISGNIVECEHHKKWKRESDLFRKYVRRGFREDGWDLKYPEGYVGTQSRFNMEALMTYIDEFKKDPEMRGYTLYLHGPQGCQKTLLAMFVGAELTRAGFDCRFIVMNDLVKKLINTRDEVSIDFIEDIQQADLIIYDEAFDLDKLTLYKSNYQLPYLDTFLRTNIRKRGNVFVSNVHPNDIDEKFGVSLKDFVQREVSYHNSLLEFKDNWRNGNGIPKDTLFTRRRNGNA